MRELWAEVGITPHAALGVVLSTTVMYLVFGGVLRLWRQRLFASPRSLDLAVVTVLGAIAGRATLGYTPTLAGGVLALATLALLELLIGGLRRLGLPTMIARPTKGRAQVLAVGGRLRPDVLRRYGLSQTTVWAALRQAGVAHLDQAALVVLEANGRISVVPRGRPVHPHALAGVRGARLVLDELRACGELDGSADGGGASAPTRQQVGEQAQGHHEDATHD